MVSSKKPAKKRPAKKVARRSNARGVEWSDLTAGDKRRAKQLLKDEPGTPIYLVPTEFGLPFVAADNHSGQGSFLYQFTSSTVVTEDELDELIDELKDGDDDAAALADELRGMKRSLGKYRIDAPESNPIGARPPISDADLRELVELGTFLDTYAGGGRKFTARGAVLCWSPRASALVVIERRLPRGSTVEAIPSKAGKVYRRWTRGREPSSVRELDFSMPKTCKIIGAAESIGYRSDKFHARGATVDYEHEFGPGVRFWTCGQGSRSVMVWRGGKLRITKDGIEG